ncbi:hypothetical protein [Oscillatoria sp. HE19RPO]|uniref:hypothetical protein n=1 Tax=Oscillatoria sp. HE19RPO TaxID=2954806 RepID=UPI0020C20410|nr:hypothetical protein [Oscillatoria sp. HE19RPO]
MDAVSSSRAKICQCFNQQPPGELSQSNIKDATFASLTGDFPQFRFDSGLHPSLSQAIAALISWREKQ